MQITHQATPFIGGKLILARATRRVKLANEPIIISLSDAIIGVRWSFVGGEAD